MTTIDDRNSPEERGEIMHTLSINKKQVAHAIGAMILSLGATQAFAT